MSSSPVASLISLIAWDCQLEALFGQSRNEAIDKLCLKCSLGVFQGAFNEDMLSERKTHRNLYFRYLRIFADIE